MKKRRILFYLLLGGCLAIYLQNIFSLETYASEIENKDVVKKNNTPNLISASEQAIKSVVHIKSKYLFEILVSMFVTPKCSLGS